MNDYQKGELAEVRTQAELDAAIEAKAFPIRVSVTSCGCRRDAVSQKLLIPCDWHAYAERLRRLANGFGAWGMEKEDRVAIAAALNRVDVLQKRLEHAQRVLREGDPQSADVIPLKRQAEDDFTFAPDPDGGCP